MHKLFGWLLPLALAGSCTPRSYSAGGANLGRYVLDGRSTRTTARAYRQPPTTEGIEGLIIRVGVPPAGPRKEVFYLKFSKPLNAPDADFKIDFLSFNYATTAGVQGLNYTGELHSTLRRTPSGGYSGTFRGTCPGSTSATGQPSTVKGTFTDVHTALDTHER